MPPLRPRPSQQVPLLPMVAALLLLLAFAQLGSWVWQAFFHSAEPADPVRAELERDNPFNNLKKIHPKVVAERMETLKPRKVVFPALDSNLQFGDAASEVVLTVLTDPSCGECRARVADVLAALPSRVRVVYKFWPQNPLRLTPGILLEMARREGVAAAYLKLIEGKRGELPDAALLELLDHAGVSLEKQRAALSDGKQMLGAALQEDIRLAQGLALGPPPVFLLNGYVLDGVVLQPERTAQYVARLQNHEALVQDSDYFLMEK